MSYHGALIPCPFQWCEGLHNIFKFEFDCQSLVQNEEMREMLDHIKNDIKDYTPDQICEVTFKHDYSPYLTMNLCPMGDTANIKKIIYGR